MTDSQARGMRLNMSRKHAARAALLLLLLTTSGCGLIVNGRYQTITIDSSPTGGNVSVDGAVHATPARVRLKRCASHTVSATNENGALVWRVIRHRTALAPVVFDLVLPLYLLNILVDELAEGTCELYPETITIPLPPPDSGPDFRSIEK